MQISCQPSVYSVVSSMSKSQFFIPSLFLSLSLSLLCSPLLSINSCSTVDAVTTFWAQRRPWAWHMNSEKCCNYNRDTAGLNFSFLSFFLFFSTSIVACATCNIFGKRFRKIKPLPVNETHNSCGANRSCLLQIFLMVFYVPALLQPVGKNNFFDGTMTHFKPKNIACDAAVPLGKGLRAWLYVTSWILRCHCGKGLGMT